MTKNTEILVVEDDPFTGKYIGKILDDNHMPYVLAASGAEARKALVMHEIGLILLDIHLPDEDGLELLKEWKNNEATKRIPILIETASEDPQAHIESIKFGAVGFIEKPINPLVLITRIKNAKEVPPAIKNRQKEARHKIRNSLSFLLMALDAIEEDASKEQRNFISKSRNSVNEILLGLDVWKRAQIDKVTLINEIARSFYEEGE